MREVERELTEAISTNLFPRGLTIEEGIVN
jgi:hypothetical protein